MIDLRHPLAVLASRMPWQKMKARVAQVFYRKGRASVSLPDLDLFGEKIQRAAVPSNAGRQRVALRITISLMHLKHAFNESDEGVVERRRDMPRWQYFSGLAYYEDRLSCDATTLIKFRHLLGEEGVEELLAQTLNVAVQLQLIPPQELCASRPNTGGLCRGQHTPEAVHDCQRDQPGQGALAIMDEAFNSDKLIEFMQALIQDAGKKESLILDNLRVHHSKPVKAWLADRTRHVEVFYLPSYSPELNPEERLNAGIKQALSKSVPLRTKAKLRDAANEHMALLDKLSERVMRTFHDPGVKYAG